MLLELYTLCENYKEIKDGEKLNILGEGGGTKLSFSTDAILEILQWTVTEYQKLLQLLTEDVDACLFLKAAEIFSYKSSWYFALYNRVNR